MESHIDYEGHLCQREAIESEIMQDLEKMRKEAESWQPFTSSENMSIYLDRQTSDIRMFVESILPISAEDFSLYHERQLEMDRPRWSEICKTNKILKEEDGLSFHYLVEDRPWPFSSRDFCLLRSYRQSECGRGCSVLARSIPDAPEQSGCVRAQMVVGAQVVEPYPGDEDKCIYRVFMHRNGEIRVPHKLLVSYIGGTVPKNIEKWVELASECREQS